jgi:outer membrane protein W
LVTSSLLFRVLAFYSLVDVSRLLVDGRKHSTGVAFKHVFAIGVTNLVDDLAGDLLYVQVYFRFYLAGKYHLTGSYEGFASYFGAGIKSQKVVNECVGDLVRDFIWVALRDRLGGK